MVMPSGKNCSECGAPLGDCIGYGPNGPTCPDGCMPDFAALFSGRRDPHEAAAEDSKRVMDKHRDELRAAIPKFGWVVEFPPANQGETAWYGMTEEGVLGVMFDKYQALRFARKEDAEMVIQDVGWNDVSAVYREFDR